MDLFLPGPLAFSLEYQRPAEEGADEHQNPQNQYIFNCGIQNDRVDNVSRNEQFKRNLNRASHDLLKGIEAWFRFSIFKKADNEIQDCVKNSQGDDQHSQDLQDKGNIGNDGRQNIRFREKIFIAIFIERNS